jgi:hypothetical protein
MHRSVDVICGVDFLCIVRLMFLVWWIFNAPFGRCYLLGGFYASLMLIGARSAPYGYVLGVVDFLCTVRLMLRVWWIFYVSFG